MWSSNTVTFGFRSSLPFVGERQREGAPASLILSYRFSHQGREVKRDSIRLYPLVGSLHLKLAQPGRDTIGMSLDWKCQARIKLTSKPIGRQYGQKDGR
jgi:hypothetical protein